MFFSGKSMKSFGACLLLAVVVLSPLNSFARASVKLTIDDAVTTDEDHYEDETSDSEGRVHVTITDTETEVVTLSLTAKSAMDQLVHVQFECYFVVEDVALDEKKVLEFKRKQVSLSPGETVEEMFTADPFTVTTVARDDRVSIAGHAYEGYIVLITDGSRVVAQKSNSTRYLKREWLQKCQQAKKDAE